MRVRVLEAGIYNGPGHRALPAANVGDVIEVADGAYADLLLAQGAVTQELSPEAGSRKLDDRDEPTVRPSERKPREPKSRKLTEINSLRDLVE